MYVPVHTTYVCEGNRESCIYLYAVLAGVSWLEISLVCYQRKKKKKRKEKVSG